MVAVGAGLVVAGVGGVLVWRSRSGDPKGADVVEPPRAAGAAIVSLPQRVSSHADFVAQMRQAMSLELPQLNRSGRQLMVAHAAYESGFGNGRAFRMGWNFGNITAGSSWKGNAWVDSGGDTEVSASGAVKTIDQKWRAYPTLQDAVRDYWAFLGGSRYLDARNVLEHSNGLDADAFAANLRSGGYFTLQLAKYQNGLASTLAQVASGWGG